MLKTTITVSWSGVPQKSYKRTVIQTVGSMRSALLYWTEDGFWGIKLMKDEIIQRQEDWVESGNETMNQEKSKRAIDRFTQYMGVDPMAEYLAWTVRQAGENI